MEPINPMLLFPVTSKRVPSGRMTSICSARSGFRGTPLNTTGRKLGRLEEATGLDLLPVRAFTIHRDRPGILCCASSSLNRRVWVFMSSFFAKGTRPLHSNQDAVRRTDTRVAQEDVTCKMSAMSRGVRKS